MEKPNLPWQLYDLDLDGGVALGDAQAVLRKFGESEIPPRLPVRAFTVVFADYEQAEHSRPFDPEEAHGIFLSWLASNNRWLKRETGLRFELRNLGVLRSTHPQTDFGMDSYGEGLGGPAGDSKFQRLVIAEEFGLLDYESGSGHARNVVLIIEGGGIASSPGVLDSFANWSDSLIGDWAVWPWFGMRSPGSIANNPWGATEDQTSGHRVTGHEQAHSFSQDDLSGNIMHNPVIWGGDVLSPAQVGFIRSRVNVEWLR